MNQNILIFTIGHRFNLPEMDQLDNIVINLPVKVRQLDYQPKNFMFNNAQINKKKFTFSYGELEHKSSVSHKLHFFQLKNRLNFQTAIKEIYQHELQMHKILFVERFGNVFNQQIKETDIAFLDIKQYDQSKGKSGYRTRFPQIIQKLRNLAQNYQYIIWPETLRPLFHTFSNNDESFSFAKNIENGPYLYLEGNINMIFSVPHGGKNIYDLPENNLKKFRSLGCEECKDQDIVTVIDKNTAELSLIIYSNFVSEIKIFSGQDYLPHCLISLTSRQQVELNRKDCMDEQCQSKVVTQLKWIYKNYHHQLVQIIKYNNKYFKSQLLIDLHGLDSKKNLTQLGYALKRPQCLELYESNYIDQKEINYLSQCILENSSLRILAKKFKNKNDRLQIIFGNQSLGKYLNQNGIHCIPSDLYNFNNSDEFKQENTIYFEGGFAIKNYSSNYNCDAVQVEMSYEVRNSKNNFKLNGINVSNAVFHFYKQNYII